MKVNVSKIKKSAVFLCLTALVLFGAVSCRTAPPVEEEPVPVPPPPIEETVQEVAPTAADIAVLDEAAARAAATRQLLIDFEANNFLPQEWEAADSLYREAVDGRDVTSLQSTRDSLASFERANAAMEAMIERTMAQNFQIIERQVIEARNAAVAAGAEELVIELLDQGDEVAEEAVWYFEGGEFHAARDAAQTATAMYLVLVDGIGAYNTWEAIHELGLEYVDQRDIARGEAALWIAADHFEAGDPESAQVRVDEAAGIFAQALDSGWVSFTAERGAAAGAVRQEGLALRANVAVREEFAAADSVYSRASAAHRASNLREASILYAESEAMFMAVNIVALERRQAAEEALLRAEQRLAESDEAARAAELILEGGTE